MDHGWFLDCSHGCLSLPDRWVRFNSPGWWPCGVILAIVHLVDIRNRDLTSAVLESLEDILGREIAAVTEDIWVIEKAEDFIRDLRDKSCQYGLG